MVREESVKTLARDSEIGGIDIEGESSGTVDTHSVKRMRDLCDAIENANVRKHFDSVREENIAADLVPREVVSFEE